MKRRRLIAYNKKMEEMRRIKEMEMIEKSKEIEESVFAIQEFENIKEEELLLTPPELIGDEKVIEPIVIIEEIDERVICINYDVVYKDNKEASELTGVSASAIKRCCNGEIKTAGKDEDGNKLVWKYVRDM